MTIENPFVIDESEEVVQSIHWTHLDNSDYGFVLFLPLKALSKQWRNKDTHYIRFAAKSTIEWKKEKMTFLFPDTLCVLSLPVKTFETAWRTVPPQIRNQLSNNNNLLIEFNKKNKESINLKFVEVKKPTQDEIDFATEQYTKHEEERLFFSTNTTINKEEY